VGPEAEVSINMIKTQGQDTLKKIIKKKEVFVRIQHTVIFLFFFNVSCPCG